MDTPPLPPHPANLPEWASDELPLLTETVGEPAIPVLQEPLRQEPRTRELPLREPQLQQPTSRESPLRAGHATETPASREPLRAERSTTTVPPAAQTAPPASRPAAASEPAMPMAQIELELHAAAQLIMQEVIDDYMLQIEAELHRRLEDHLAKILRAGRR